MFTNTTYNASYGPLRLLPPITKFGQTPVFEINDSIFLPPRYFPINPCGPHRQITEEIPLGPGFSGKDINTEKLLDVKPIVKTLPPPEEAIKSTALLKKRKQSAKVRKILDLQHYLEPPVDDRQQILDSLSNASAYVSSTKKASDDIVQLPPVKPVEDTGTFELNSDMVKYRPKKYEQTSATWQGVFDIWDKGQTRYCADQYYQRRIKDYCDRIRELTRAENGRSSQDTETEENQEVMEELETDENEEVKGKSEVNIINTDFTRPLPGYAGFVPRSRVHPPPRTTNPMGKITSMMRESYKSICLKEYNNYKKAGHAHKSPLSKTVTLTYPYNPFNKIEQKCLSY